MYAAESTNYRRLVEALQKLRKPVTSNSYLADFEVASDRFRPLLLDRPARLAQSRYVLQASGIALRRMKPGWRRSASLCERSEPKTPASRSSLYEGRRRQRILDVRAADLQEEMANQCFRFRQLRRRRRQPDEHRRERSEQSNKSAMREQDRKKAAI
jgi:hypothetical protein